MISYDPKLLHVENSHLDKFEDVRLQLFKKVHSKYEPCILWHFSNLYRNYLKQCKTTMTLLVRFVSRQYNSNCIMCSLKTDQLILHATMFCETNSERRHKMWKSLYDAVKNENFQLFIKLPPDLQLLQMFAGLPSFDLEDNARVHAFKTILNFFASIRI